ncbi:MAG: hypothetical protein OHK0053_04750 [Microscillaceae bacterium]
MKKILKRLVNALGYDIYKLPNYWDALLSAPTMEGGLARSALRQLPIHTVIDVGASNGSWTAMCQKHYPKASYLLIEAQEAYQPQLEAFKRNYPNVHYVLQAAGPQESTIYFDAETLEGGAVKPLQTKASDIAVPVTTIDNQVKKHGLKDGFLIKLDTHGFEVPILEGAQNTLTTTEMLIIEAYNFSISAESLLFFELCEYLYQRGFRVVDMVDIVKRPKDKALWQLDIFFLKSENAIFSSDQYQ